MRQTRVIHPPGDRLQLGLQLCRQTPSARTSASRACGDLCGPTLRAGAVIRPPVFSLIRLMRPCRPKPNPANVGRKCSILLQAPQQFARAELEMLCSGRRITGDSQRISDNGFDPGVLCSLLSCNRGPCPSRNCGGGVRNGLLNRLYERSNWDWLLSHG